MLAVVTDKKNIDKYKKIGASAFIFGLKDYSSGYYNNLEIDEIREIVKNNKDIEVFISADKNLFNDELKDLEKKLKKLNEIDIKGLLFYDMAILRMKKNNNFKFDLVWNQTFMVTNYNTCNYYYEKGVKYGFVSKEITLPEINEISTNTKMELFTFVFGYPNMSYSRRKLLTNFYESIGKKKEKDLYIIKNNDEDYIVREEDEGSSFYYGKILNYAKVLNDINAKYLVLNDSFIDDDTFEKVLSLYNKIIKEKDYKYVKEVENLVGDYEGFLNTKTIYKVKKNG